MAIQYYMRGYDAILDIDVDWVVNDTPDTSGTYSGSVNPLTNIRVNRTVQSPVDSLIKPSIPSFVSNQIPGISQNFLYLNSYDWVYPGYPNIVPPVTSIPIPAANYGIAVMRGSATLPTPNNYASLYWNETNSQWTFNVLDSGTFNPTGSVSLAVGSPTPTTGIIRIPNNEFITALDSTGLIDVPIIGLNNAGNNRVEIGNTLYGAYVPGQLIADQYLALTDNSSGATIVASSGLIRAPNNTVALAFADNATLSILDAVSSTAIDEIVIGESANNQGVVYRVGDIAGYHKFEINGSAIFSIYKDNINGDNISFDKSSYNPTIKQITQDVGNGKPITIEAQSSSDVAGSGGDVILSSGSGPISSGYVDLRIAGIPKFRVNDTTIISYNGLFQFERNLASVDIEQETISNAFGLASNFTISSQDNNGIGGTGGDLILDSGQGGVGGNNGNLIFRVGSNDYLTIGTDQYTFNTDTSSGIYNFQVGGMGKVNIDNNKFITLSGRRRNVTPVDDATYPVSYTIVDTDDVISVTSITGVYTVYLPATPTTGDTYTIKDSGGNALAFTITVDANGGTIDSALNFPLNIDYQSVDVIYTGSEWSII